MDNNDSKYFVQLLNYQDDKDILLYEKALYRAFPLSRYEPLDPCFIYDHKSRRMNTVISYKKQNIYTIKTDDRVISALSVNVDMSDELQLEMDGFKVDRNEKNICEVLQMFNFGELKYLKDLSSFSLLSLKEIGFTKIYATCSNKYLKPYLSLGFELIESVESVRHLLLWQII